MDASMVTCATSQLSSTRNVERDASARGRILIPLDGTCEAARAVPVARALARYRDAAIDPVLITGSDEAAEIVRLAEERGSSLIALATHARGELGRLLHGSVAEHVVALARVPVLLVPPGARVPNDVRTLLVPVDESRGSKRAFGVAARLAREHAARVELITIIQGTPAYLRQPLPGVNLSAAFAPTWQSARLAEEEALHTLAERFSRSGLHVGYHAAIGPVAGAIVRAADELHADLIVMSTHALTGPTRTILGSVCASVVRNAHRPVLLVHRDARPGIETSTRVNMTVVSLSNSGGGSAGSDAPTTAAAG
jgi:nucleotide-binding universal stress UspA family protein